MGASIVDEIEFSVAASAVELELALRLSVILGFASGDDRLVGRQKMVTDGLHKSESFFKAALGVVVKKDATDPTWLMAVGKVKILVADLFKLWVVHIAEGLASGAGGLVPMDCIFALTIVGREVKASTKPPDWLAVFRLSVEVAYVHVRGRHVRIARMHDKRNTHRAKVNTSELWSLGGG